MAMSKEIINDLSDHFETKLRRLVRDTADICNIADIKKVDTLKLIVAGLMTEIMYAIAVMHLSEEEYLKMCSMAYKTLINDVREALSK